MGDFGFQWHITDRCANRCRHCYQDSFGNNAELTIEELTAIADCVMRGVDGLVSVNVTGGEPLLYGEGRGEDVFTLMERLSIYDNLDELNIITSAAGMNGSTVDRLKALPKLTSVKVSLESDDPAVNDHIRGTGNFGTVTRHVNALARAGLPVVVMATLGGHNYRCVGGLCDLAISLGARGVIFERFVPLGRGADIRDSVLTSREWTEVLRAICRVGGMDIGTSISELLPYKAFLIDMPCGLLGDACSVSGAPCCLGAASMALMPDGTVYPCRRAPIPTGKLPDDGMAEILKRLHKFSSRQQMCFEFDF